MNDWTVLAQVVEWQFEGFGHSSMLEYYTHSRVNLNLAAGALD